MCYAQSPTANQEAHAQFRELRAMVGDADTDLPAWADRLAVLDGPGQPLWATGYGLDFSWIDIPVFDDRGRPLHREGLA